MIFLWVIHIYWHSTVWARKVVCNLKQFLISRFPDHLLPYLLSILLSYWPTIIGQSCYVVIHQQLYTLSSRKENFQNFISIGCPVCHRRFKLYRQSMQTSLTQSCKVQLSFSTTSCLVSKPSNGLSRKTDLGFGLPIPSYPVRTCSQNTRFLLVPSLPMGFRENLTLDSNSPPLITP